MSSLRTRIEIQESTARSEREVTRPKEHIRAGYTTQAVTSRTRDRQVAEEASKPVPKTQAELAVDRRIAEHGAQVDARLAHEAEVWRKQQEEPIKQAQVELTRRVQAKKDAAAATVRTLEEEMILDVLHDATDEEAQAAANIVKTKYSGSRETFAWEIALKEVRQNAETEQRACEALDKIPMHVIESKTDAELAEFLNVDVEVAAKARSQL